MVATGASHVILDPTIPAREAIAGVVHRAVWRRPVGAPGERSYVTRRHGNSTIVLHPFATKSAAQALYDARDAADQEVAITP